MNKVYGMNKYISYLAAFLIIYVLVVTGCGSTAGDSIIVHPPEYISESTVSVNLDGSINAYTQSGISIIAERNTFDPEVKVKLTENKVFEGIDGNFSSISSLYTISAEKVHTDSLGETKSKVTSVSKQFTLRIPNSQSEAGVYYIGSRANSNSPWKYTLINDKNSQDNPLPIDSRLALNNNAPEFFVSTYNVDFQFSLFIEKPSEKKDDGSKTVITGFKAEAEPSEYELENGYYTKDLIIKATISGDNIGNLTSSSYIAEIGFLNDDAYNYSMTSFPISGAVASYEVSEPNEGAGNKFKHTITLKNISDYNNNTLSFGIAASKLTQEILPDNFTLTIRVDGTSQVLAYEDTKGITLTPKQKPSPDPVTATASMLIPATINAALATNIIIAFSDKVDWQPESKSLVTLYQGEKQVDCEYTYYSSNNTLTLTPTAKLLFNNKYTVNVSKLLTNAENDQQFEFTTVESAGTPSITPDTSKSSDGKYYLVADQKFYIDFNLVIKNEENANKQIYVKKNDADLQGFNIAFNPEKSVATVNIDVPLEADQTYTVGVSEFSDSDGTIIKPANFTFETLPSLIVKSIELDYGEGWKTASGSLEVPTAGKIKVKLNQNVEPSYVKFVDNGGNEITGSQVFNKTAERSDTIEFEYRDLEFLGKYGIVVSWVDPAMGMNFVSDAHTFVTTYPDHLVLQDPSNPVNSETNPYLIYCAKALDQIRESDYLAKGYWFKQMADIDLDPAVYSCPPNNTSTAGWKPFGRFVDDTPVGFAGHYDGNGKTINNLTINSSNEEELPSLFGVIESGSVDNLGFTNVNINGKTNVAALAGHIKNADIANCYVSGTISGTDCVGGLIGNMFEGSLENSYSSNLTITGNTIVGGLVGIFGSTTDDTPNATMIGCHSDNINFESVSENESIPGNIGGVVGVNRGSLDGCYSSGRIISNKLNIGGVVGVLGDYDSTSDIWYNGWIDQCYSSAEVKGYDWIGGVIGTLADPYHFDINTLKFKGTILPTSYKEPSDEYNPCCIDKIVYNMPL